MNKDSESITCILLFLSALKLRRVLDLQCINGMSSNLVYGNHKIVSSYIRTIYLQILQQKDPVNLL
jgi:hypothetical protein